MIILSCNTDGTLGNRAFFIGSNTGFALSTTQFPELRPNSIYFTDNQTPLYSRSLVPFYYAVVTAKVMIFSLNELTVMVDYTAVFVFRLLMFVDNGLAAGMGLDFGWQQRYGRFCGRIAVLSVLALLLYPFLWAWTIIGTLWFTSARDCWLARRQAHLLRAQQGIPISEFGVLVDMIRVPDWAFEAAGQEMRGMGQDATSYHPGLYLSHAQREAVEALIQELPMFRMKAVPTDCSECPICLEEFVVGNEVRGLPCAHNFHVACIDEWLRLNVKCPRCRCSVFPNLDLSALSNIRADPERPSTNVVTAARYVRSQPSSQSYLLRLQGFLRPVRTEDAGPSTEVTAAAQPTVENGALTSAPDSHGNVERVEVLVEHSPRQL
ncbi:E3 ubiquitin-protein ligase SIS3 [Capsicum annuum]|nr:E3 ubiquitin-protein ligase SIS3 [Capsicum annuum]